MDPADYVERWMLPPEAGGDEGDFLRGVLCSLFWFPLNYHPELGDPFMPAKGDDISFWTTEFEEKKVIAIYSAPELMRMALEPQGRPYSRARMKGADIFVALRDTNYPMVINPWPHTAIIFPPQGIRWCGRAL